MERRERGHHGGNTELDSRTQLTIYKKDDRLLLGSIFWFGNVGLQTGDCLDPTFGLAFVDFSREAAG